MPHSEPDWPSTKRQKIDAVVKASSAPKQGSAIFAPFRAIGLVSPTGVPFTSIPLGKTTFQITTSVGRALQTFDLRRGLNLVFVTRPQTPADITATYAWKERVFAAWGDPRNGEPQGLWAFQRGKKAAELQLPADLDQPIKQILIFGSWIVACALTRIEVWKSATLEHYTSIFTAAARKGDNEITGGVCNMPTFLNKIFVGRRDGWVEIWNVSTAKLIYTILPPAPDCGAVTCLQPSPALSLLAIAYSEGPLVIQNVLTDKLILRLNAGNDDAPVTCISFRSDGQGAGEDGRNDGVMATATSASGDVTLWDLNKGGRIMGVLRSAHNPPSHNKEVRGGVTKVEFLPGQPVIVTSGLDNSLKSWIFDESPFSPVPRILHMRSGHAAPVRCLQFLPSDFDGAEGGNKWLLSGGRDRSLWGWSLRRDGQSSELSQGAIRKKARKIGILAGGSLSHGPTTTLDDLKAPEITCIASSLNRDGGMGAMPGKQMIWDKGDDRNKLTSAEISSMTGWESVVTAHKDDPWARTWFWGRKRAGRWAFKTGDGENVSTVAISPCGSFALVGSAGGNIDMFNLQSGRHRQRFPSRLTPAQLRQLKMQQLRALDEVNKLQSRANNTFAPGTGRHTKAVTGIVVDSLNRTVISCSLDGKIKFWDFVTGNLVHEIDWAPMTKITACRYHAANDLIAFACDDHSIRVVDVETKRTIREFWGCRGDINDFCFSNDGRWIVAASQDAVIRVWDLPTSHLIDAFRLEKPCTALAFSATGEYLAGAVEGDLGVQIWTNRTLFKHVPTRQISDKEIGEISAPTASGEGGQGLIEAAFEADGEKQAQDDDGVTAPVLDQLSADMMTLSLVPKSRWQTLLHIDLIKARNKPKEAPKAPEKAPFFLPSVGGSNSLVPAAEETKGKGKESGRGSRLTQLDRTRNQQALTSKLLVCGSTGDYTDFLEHLKSLPPAAADLELRSLSIGDGDNASNELLHFIKALTSRLIARRDYELTQAWMTVFLRLHFDLVMANESLLQALAEWKEYQARERERLDDLVGYCGGVVGFLRSPRT
ncbi:Utp21-domain-containing protein [Parathielavia appendiculata]|uniref:Utp21-domain-containing protein n=1 Tax=Parathielavia appendiculata TaxID=2587402 RepID=A0AAN6U2Y7_9PEZI|nr:Utp21-domain-containing protein [Parathielavia appendiculata]